MEQDKGASLRDRAAQSNPQAVSSKASIPSADEIAEACANSVKPDLFAPILKRVADELYCELQDGVRDYLVDNTRFNISTMIESAHRAERRERERAERAEKENAKLHDLLDQAIQSGLPDNLRWVALQMRELRQEKTTEAGND